LNSICLSEQKVITFIKRLHPEFVLAPGLATDGKYLASGGGRLGYGDNKRPTKENIMEYMM
jgi:hypothetical protein